MRKKYSDEFKSHAVRLFLNTENATYVGIAAELNIVDTTLRRWVLEYQQDLLVRSSFENSFDNSRIGNFVQASTIQNLTISTVSGTGDVPIPLQVGIRPQLAASRQARPADDQLASALDFDGSAITCQVLSGMGGVGKTQIAAAFASQQWKSKAVDLLVWINATTRDNVTAAFAEAAVEILGPSSGGNEQEATRFLSWLARPSGRRWLIVIDDLTNPEDLAGLWPPESTDGRTVVTTRCRDAALDGMSRHRVDIGLFAKDEAIQYITDRLEGRVQRLAGADELVEALGYLPLALAQAAAYILDLPGLSCERYRELLEDRANRLAELSPEALPDGYGRTVAAAWSLSLDLAERRSVLGVSTKILRLASVLDPNGIPIEIFTSNTVIYYLVSCVVSPGSKLPMPLDASVIHRTMGILHRLSLVDFDGVQVRVHALIQRAVFDDVDDSGREMLPRTAADAVAEVWPEPDNSLAASLVLRSNIDYLLGSAAESLCSPCIHPVLSKVGFSLGTHGQVTMAASYFQRLYKTVSLVLGANHPDTLEACYNQAICHGAAGDVERTLEALQLVLDGRQLVLGPDHPDTRNVQDSIRFWQSELKDSEATSGLRLTYIDARSSIPPEAHSPLGNS